MTALRSARSRNCDLMVPPYEWCLQLESVRRWQGPGTRLHTRILARQGEHDYPGVHESGLLDGRFRVAVTRRFAPTKSCQKCPRIEMQAVRTNILSHLRPGDVKLAYNHFWSSTCRYSYFNSGAGFLYAPHYYFYLRWRALALRKCRDLFAVWATMSFMPSPRHAWG